MSFPSGCGHASWGCFPKPVPTRRRKTKRPEPRPHKAEETASASPVAAPPVAPLNLSALSALARDAGKEATGAHDEEIRRALRTFREDESDVTRFVALVVCLWRTGMLKGGAKRTIMPMVRLAKKGSRRGMTHPWGVRRWRRGRQTGRWWSFGPGNWNRPDGRTWLMAASDKGDCIYWHSDTCLPFDSVAGVADYVTERALEWRVVERT